MRAERIKYMLLVFGAVVLSIPSIIRNFPFLNISFLHIKSQVVNSFAFFYPDPFSVGSKMLSLTPYDWLMNLFPSFLSPTKTLPILFGVLFLFFMYKILYYKKLSEEVRLLTIFISILTPTFIAAFILNNPFSLILLLNTIGIYATLRRSIYPVLIVYLLLSFFGPFVFMVSLFILTILNYEWFKKHMKILSIPIVAFVVHTSFLINFGYNLSSLNFNIDNLLMDFGAVNGIGFFVVAASLAGISLYWKKYRRELILVVIGIIIALFYKGGNYFIFPFLCLLSSLAIFRMRSVRWKSTLLKNLTLGIIILGMVFSTISYEDQVINAPPTNDYEEGFKHISDLGEDAVIISHPSTSTWIQAISNKKTFLDLNSDDSDDYHDRKEVYNRIFHTYNLRKATETLESNSINYIVVDKRMKNGLEWKRENQEFLNLLTNEENFEKEFNNNEMEIWRYEG